jgi:hypothetical protein
MLSTFLYFQQQQIVKRPSLLRAAHGAVRSHGSGGELAHPWPSMFVFSRFLRRFGLAAGLALFRCSR